MGDGKEGWWRGFMDALNADMLFHRLACPQQNIWKASKPKALRFGKCIFIISKDEKKKT